MKQPKKYAIKTSRTLLEYVHCELNESKNLDEAKVQVGELYDVWM